MLKSAISQMSGNGQSYYSFVIAVAKRAREIVEEADEVHVRLEEKPVKQAVNEFVSGKYRFVEDPSLHNRKLR